MYNRNDIMNYFIGKYQGNESIIRLLQNKTDHELQELYNKSLKRDEQEKEILENGTITYRIHYNTKKDEQEIVNFMKENDMFCLYEGQFDYQIRVGNYCIVGVPVHFVEQLKEKFNDNIKYIDLERKIIGKKDIKNLKVGDKVKIILDGIFGQSTAQGTVYYINENEVVVRKYKSKTKGYILKVGHEGEIEKIEKFKKETA